MEALTKTKRTLVWRCFVRLYTFTIWIVDGNRNTWGWTINDHCNSSLSLGYLLLPLSCLLMTNQPASLYLSLVLMHAWRNAPPPFSFSPPSLRPRLALWRRSKNKGIRPCPSVLLPSPSFHLCLLTPSSLPYLTPLPPLPSSPFFFFFFCRSSRINAWSVLNIPSSGRALDGLDG